MRIIEQKMDHGVQFVGRRVDRGEPAFVQNWERMGGQARYDRSRDWFSRHRDCLVEAVG